MSRSPGFPISVGACPDCGKLRWVSRREAKLAATHVKSRRGRLHAYPCGNYWHLGHPPSLLVRGVISRDQVGDAVPRTQVRKPD